MPWAPVFIYTISMMRSCSMDRYRKCMCTAAMDHGPPKKRKQKYMSLPRGLKDLAVGLLVAALVKRIREPNPGIHIWDGPPMGRDPRSLALAPGRKGVAVPSLESRVLVAPA